VYLREADALGAAGARVTLTDANGAIFTATTNAAGNFYLATDGRRGREGGLAVTTPLAFPVTVTVSASGAEKRMRSKVQREGSCAACHLEPPGAATVGKVYVE
jgi:hypothetical protein